jgi:hypothetical protein
VIIRDGTPRLDRYRFLLSGKILDPPAPPTVPLLCGRPFLLADPTLASLPDTAHAPVSVWRSSTISTLLVEDQFYFDAKAWSLQSETFGHTLTHKLRMTQFRDNATAANNCAERHDRHESLEAVAAGCLS